MARFLSFIVILCFSQTVFSQYSLSGRVVDSKKQTPVPFAAVSIPALELWATADAKGVFTLKNVPAGKISIQVEYLGYETKVYEVEVNRNISTISIALNERNLLLNEVVVTGRKKASSLSTSYIMDRTALDHMQMLNVTDVTSLLPGGKTNSTLHLATPSAQTFSINGTSGEMGNAVFGVAVEVDGVRLSNSALPGMAGYDVRNIPSTNVESVEIVTGVPSVEYGDMTNGMVKINSRKGKSPFILEMMTKPNTKQISLAKGLELGPKSGVLNVSLEYTKSISSLASPYTSYTRNALSLNYSNTFNKRNRKPVFLDIGLTGNIGGYNSGSDPDMFVNTYSKMKDNVLRGNFKVRWLLNKPWITNLEVSGGVNYNDRLTESSTNSSSASSVAAIHATTEGYHVGQTYAENPNADIILIEPGYYYQVSYNDSKVLNYTGSIKGNWSRKWGKISNNLMVGGEYNNSGNNGRGSYYANMRYAPTWREYRYDKLPDIIDYALYAEDRLTIPINKSLLRLIAGVRSDNTYISGSVYGTSGNFSPRFNGEFVFWEKSKSKIRDLSVKLGWGKTVKLPSFSILYPETNYRDILTFAPGTTSDGKTYYAYYTIPSTTIYNPNLKWQYNVQNEISVNTNIDGTRISLIASQDKTYRSYVSSATYTPFTYKFTGQSSLEQSAIPIANRVYGVDKNSGVVTVTDKTGTLPSETLSFNEITRFISNRTQVNGSPVLRRRLSWIVDFKQIASLRTAFHVDGNYYYYRGVEETVTAYMPNSTITMADGNPYKYIGFFTGGANSANGSTTKSVNMNITSTTHIPSIRLIISARLECSLYNYSQNLSEKNGAQRGFVLDSRDEYTPSTTKGNDIYGKDRFVGLYPDYYISLDDMAYPIPFAEKFLWAKQNDVPLYNELAKMVIKSNYNYYFNPNKVSVYYSANIGVTKEIGRSVSISFNAINFINNMAKVKSTWNNGEASLFGTSYIPSFYYGLSLRLKI